MLCNVTGPRVRSILAIVSLMMLGPVGALHAGDSGIEFNRDIRPILSENCYTCHGPDAQKREASLRLDDENATRAELPSGVAAIVPGDADGSELVFRVETDEPTLLMPPPDSGKSLSPDQVAVLRRWVEAGAAWEPHWSLAAIRRPDTPDVGDPGFVKNPIDTFILRKLAEHGLEHAPEADRVTLIRRLSFDLRGLPPTPEEVAAFVADERARRL